MKIAKPAFLVGIIFSFVATVNFLALKGLDHFFLPNSVAWLQTSNIWAVALLYWGVCFPASVYTVRRSLNLIH